MSSPSSIAVALQRLALRTGRGRGGAVWLRLHRWVARLAGAVLTRGETEASVYVRGGLGSGDFIPGLSDIDLAIVLADDGDHGGAGGTAAARVRRRWLRLRRVPLLTLVLDWPRIYDQSELAALSGRSSMSYGLDASAAAGYFGARASLDSVRQLERPGLYGPSDDWSLIGGPERRSPQRPYEPRQRRVAAWLELVYWWRLFGVALIDPDLPRAADMCVKVVAEPARIWLWLTDQARPMRRVDALERAAERLPEEAASLRAAAELWRALPGSPRAPLAESLEAGLRLSTRIATVIGAEVKGEGSVEVKLLGEPSDLIVPDHGSSARLVPLADWRAIASPDSPDEALDFEAGRAIDIESLTLAARLESGPYPAFRSGDLLLLPGRSLPRTRLRSIQSALTDPVSFALIEGRSAAAFPEAAGWAARDVASRAVAEHRAWLGAPAGSRGPAPNSGEGLGLLFTAARAALFAESVESGDPALALTASETASQLGEHDAAASTTATDGLEAYRRFASDGREPPDATVAALRRVVGELPAYR